VVDDVLLMMRVFCTGTSEVGRICFDIFEGFWLKFCPQKHANSFSVLFSHIIVRFWFLLVYLKG
jgi:hypothetical protein